MASSVVKPEPFPDTLRLAAEDNATEKAQSRKSSLQDQNPSESTEKSEEDEGKGGLGVYFVSRSGDYLPYNVLIISVINSESFDTVITSTMLYTLLVY
jgi:hypothetical protein